MTHDPSPEDPGPELFARKMGEQERKQARPRGRRRLDPRFAAYLAGQISVTPQPSAAAISAAYEASAHDLTRPRKGALSNELA